MSKADFDDVDAELLAMAAGDDESDSGDGRSNSGDSTQVVNVPTSPVGETTMTNPKAEEPPPSQRKGVAQKVKSRGRKKASGQELENGPLDLGRSSSSAASNRSSSVRVSGAETPDSLAEDKGPSYPVEGRFMSEAEREHIMSMPEIKREEILAERAAEILKKQQDAQLKKALATSQAGSKSKRKAETADLDDGAARKTSRAKVEQTNALDDYKKAREAKGSENGPPARQAKGRKGKNSRSPSAPSDRDAPGENEIGGAAGPTTARGEPESDLQDLEQARIGRSRLARWCFFPKFEETMTGCFCRVSFGVNHENGQNLYWVAQIKGFTEGRPYAIDTPSGRSIKTDQHVLVALGSSVKALPFSACSDSPFQPMDFQRHRETPENERIPLPRKNRLEQKVRDLRAWYSVDWTPELASAKFARQDAMAEKLDPTNQVKMKREAILKRKAEAEGKGDDEETARCEAELVALKHKPATSALDATTVRLSPARASLCARLKEKQEKKERLNMLTSRTRMERDQAVRKKMAEDRRRLQESREKAVQNAKAKKLAEEEGKANAGSLAVPGARSDMAELFGDSPSASRAGTPMSGTGTPGKPTRSRLGTPMGALKKGLSVGAMGQMPLEDEVGDLGIDVEI